MLNEGRVSCGNRRMLVLGRTGFGVARFSCLRFNARTKFGPSFDGMLLGHDLLALDAALLVTRATGSVSK